MQTDKHIEYEIHDEINRRYICECIRCCGGKTYDFCFVFFFKFCFECDTTQNRKHCGVIEPMKMAHSTL